MNLKVETIVKMFRIKDQNCWHKEKNSRNPLCIARFFNTDSDDFDREDVC